MEIREHVPLAPYTNYCIGGPARYFAIARTVDEVRAGLKAAQQHQLPLFILAGGTNVLIPDEGLDRFVLKLELGGVRVDGQEVTAGAGTMMSELVDATVEQGLAGLAWAGGLPGTVGGAVRGNAGAFGGEIKDTLSRVSALTPNGELKTYSQADCQFGYRESRFKHNEEIILEATLSLTPGNSEELADEAESRRQYRRDKHPLDHPNAGSTFKNIPVEQISESVLAQFREKVKNDPFPVLPIAVLIAAANLKGFRVGDAAVSEKHSNYIVNLGHATAANVKAVIAHVKATVNAQFGVEPEEEILVL